MRFVGHRFAKATAPLRTFTQDGVSLRFDYDQNPEAWAVLHLTEADLEEMLAMLRTGRESRDVEPALSPDGTHV